MKQFILEGYRGYDLWLTVWDDVESPKAVVQIFHGMAEHIGRYAHFAEYLNSLGYIVVGDDHRAHGRTAGEGKLGTVPDGDCFADTIQDEIVISEYVKHEYGLPLIVFGHSYGSFLAQGYIQRASGDIIGAVLCGSACQSGAPVALGKFVASAQVALQGKDKPGHGGHSLRSLAKEAAHGQPLEVEACLFGQDLFGTGARSHEENVYIVELTAQFFGDSQGRKDMAACATGCEKDAFHELLPMLLEKLQTGARDNTGLASPPGRSVAIAARSPGD